MDRKGQPDFNIEFYEPEQFRTQHKSNRQASNNELINPPMFFERAPNWRLTASATIKKHHEISLSVFEKLLEEGVCREQARGVLPQNMYTEIYWPSYSRRRSMGNSTSSKCNARDNRRTLASCSFQL